MNPTVSVNKTGLWSGNVVRLVVGSKVANSLSSTMALDLVKAFKRVDFPELGVARQSHHRIVIIVATTALRIAMRSDAFSFFLERVNAIANATSIDFQFRFPWTSRADTAAQSAQGQAFANQPWQQIFQLRQLHLQFTFSRLRSLRENVENQFSAIDNFYTDHFFQSALLICSQFLIDDTRFAPISCTISASSCTFPEPRK